MTLVHQPPSQMKQRQRKRKRQGRKSGEDRVVLYPETNHRRVEPTSGEGEESARSQEELPAPFLTHAIRATGILPIAVLIGILTTHHFYTDQIPQWFLPVIEMQVAALTLCAGHAGIIGLWINRDIKHKWSSVALILAALATAGAGYRSIGEEVAGHVVVTLLVVLFAPAIWAESISCGLSRFCRFLRTKKGLLTIAAVFWVPLVLFNQWQNENYIRNWLIIPMAILLGVLVSVLTLWLMLRLFARYLPLADSWRRKGQVKTNEKRSRRGNRD